MGTVKEIIEIKNDLLIRLAFTNDISEVRGLMKQVRTLEHEIHSITHN